MLELEPMSPKSSSKANKGKDRPKGPKLHNLKLGVKGKRLGCTLAS